ncbi:MAG: hydrolase [Sandaracinus sp.]|nr:hydrolase [Sandaracinus sp.]
MRPLPLLLLLAACGASSSAAPPSPAPRPGPDLGDGVGVYTSGPRAFRTHSFWIAGPEGTVLIDTQFTPSEALRAKAAAERATGQPVTHALVLHANPDKFNGTPALQTAGVEVWTATSVAAAIPEVDAIRRRWFEARYAPDSPAETPAPTPFPDHTETLQLAGLRLRVHVLGPGVSTAQLVVEHAGHLFVGDLLANGHHAWMELGDLDAWRARLDELAALSPRWLHPGRGASGGPELLRAQRAYFDRVEALVRAHPDASTATLRAEVEEAFPELGHPVFLRVGLPAVRRWLQQRPPSAASPSAPSSSEPGSPASGSSASGSSEPGSSEPGSSARSSDPGPSASAAAPAPPSARGRGPGPLSAAARA